jgi:flagellar protein FliS
MRTQAVHQQYLATQVNTADRLQLVVMLYEGAIGFLQQAKACLAAKDASGKGRYLGKALDIIAELSASLNFAEGGEVAANLFRLYSFLTRHLTQANLTGDARAVDEVIEMLASLKECWESICQKARKGGLEGRVEGSPPAAAPSLGSLVV